MANFLENYETANATIHRFWLEFPNGRLFPDHVKDETDLAKGYITVRTEVYRDHNDVLPAAVDYAYGNVAFFPENMKKWFVEDTVTSSVARAIKLLSPTANRPSFEDMDRVEKLATVPFPKSLDDVWTPSEVTHISTAVDQLVETVVTGGQPGDKECQHGFMIRKEGISPKTGKPYKGWTCPSKNRDFQCRAIWEN
ncbi:hypothetical protein UFOVP1281_21 [uncultured Caudovirales phage]|uniref:Uncharacterized protein n=1 Tax=uncultured Caudovirales phage TaxID=2100421 RepID=A0A6J5RLF9_9CAUD|nr:hypothetical protein UFOVP1281_21 [uncultured Caudovirales phage]